MTRFAAINTKLKARKQDFLSEQAYKMLMEKASLSEVIRYLREHKGYRILLRDFDMDTLHRGQIEMILKKNVVTQVEKMILYFNQQYRQFFLTWLLSYEIEDLKVMIRAITRKEDLRTVEVDFVHSRKYSTLQYEVLMKAKTMEQFLNGLKGTIYHAPLRSLSQEDISKREFHMEMQLEILYYNTLMSKSKQLSKEDQRMVREIIGTQIDLLNIQWIYRASKYYKILPEEIVNYTIPRGRSLRYTMLKSLCYCKNEQVFMDLINTTGYGKIFPNTEDMYIERRIKRYIYKIALRFRSRQSMNITEALAYMYLLDTEMRDIISIIESVRYQIDPVSAGRYLIHK